MEGPNWSITVRFKVDQTVIFLIIIFSGKIEKCNRLFINRRWSQMITRMEKLSKAITGSKQNIGSVLKLS